MGNPFLEDSGDMLTLDTKVTMNKYAIRTVNAVEEIGQRHFSESVEDRLKIASNKPLSDSVSKNKLALFSTPQTKQRSRSKEQVASLKTNCTLSSIVSTLLAKLGKVTSTVSLNMEIRRALHPFLIWAKLQHWIEIEPNGMLNKVLTISKYSFWDRCQGIGRGCNCAYGQARRLSNI